MFRFTIRDVLQLTVVVALVVGWVADRWRVNDGWLNRIEGLRLDLRNSGVFLYDDDEGRLRHSLIPSGKAHLNLP